MLGIVVDVIPVPVLDDPSRVHHGDAVRVLGDDAEIVSHEGHRGVELALEAVDQIQHLRLHRDVERRGRLVGDEQRGAQGERHRDHGPLPHAA
jgi:hypothetical protein